MTSRDRAIGVVREAGGAELLERLLHLEHRGNERDERDERGAVKRASDNAWRTTSNGSDVPAPRRGDALDYDVIVAGGGLWSLLAPTLAARGLRVAVVERARTGASHREWNASEDELAALVHAGIVDASGIADLIVARYDYGTCRFAGGGTWPVRGVLDRAVDASALLGCARRLGESRGVSYLDGRSVIEHASGRGGVRVDVRETTAGRVAGSAPEVGDDRRDLLTAKVLVDARGAMSPYATADLVCPTVGGVLEGLEQGTDASSVNPKVGEILATTEGIEDGRQHVWEAFPGRPGETTVYLFYYARARERGSLLALYGRFFEKLAIYKRGDARLLRPTFGWIPGWSRLTAPPAPPDDRVVLVGDAAARHSPLTYCGFGATLRSLVRAADAIAQRAAEGDASPHVAVDDAPVHALTGALAHIMATSSFRGDELNALLDAAFATLHEMGNERYAALLRDRMEPRDFVAFLRKTAARHPAVWGKVIRGLGPLSAGRWGLGVARSIVQPREH